MVRPIMRDVLFLGQKSEPATQADMQVVRDLLDTLQANRAGCVGMINPVIVKKCGAYETEEGCLAVSGVRKTIRYQEIEVEFLDINWKKQRQKFSGWIAQIIQHECDHLEGIII